MKTTDFTTNAAHFVEAFGTTAHSAIDAWRAGGERLGEFTAQRWDHAFKQASPRLTPQTRKNATNAKKVFGRYYSRGLALSTSGAEVAVDTLVQAAATAIERAAALKQTRTGA